MNLYSIYFSPVGGTKRTLEIISQAWRETPREIDLSLSTANDSANMIHPDDICLIGMPSFSGRVPRIAMERLALIKGNGAAAVLVVAYGNRAYDDTLIELKDVADACGFHAIAAIAAVTEHSIFRRFATGRPDAADELVLKDFVEQIKSSQLSAKTSATLTVPGKRPYRAYSNLPLKPKANKNCLKCGLCAKSCPVGAIPLNNPSETGEKCISCMRCVAVCPVKARSLSKLILAVAEKTIEKACSERKECALFLPE